MRNKIIKLSRTYFYEALFAIIIIAASIAALTPVKVIVIIDGKQKTVYSNKVLVRDILRENKILVSEADLVQPDLNAPLAVSDDRTINIARSKRVILKKEGFQEIIYSRAADEQEVINSLKADSLSSYTVKITPSLSKTRAISFIPRRTIEKKIYVYFNKDGKVVSNPPAAAKSRYGVKELKVREFYEGRLLLSRIIVSEKILKTPKDKQRTLLASRYSVKTSRGQTDRPGEGREGTKYLIMVATAYAPGAGAGYITATGKKARYGIVAVDPRVIPLGTRLYIPGYGYAVAADTGGAIKGNRIDLCFNTRAEAIKWGRRKVKVYIIN